MIARGSPLFGVYQKIDRADKHIRDLKRTISKFQQINPYTLSLYSKEVLRKNTRYVYKVAAVKQPPPRVPLIIGDALHNLRSSLNHLAFALCRLRGKSTRNVNFPIAETPDSFYAEVCKAHVETLGKDLIEKLEGVQPYHAEYGALSYVSRLNNRDKHRELIVTTMCAAIMVGTAIYRLPEDFMDIDTTLPYFQTFKIIYGKKNPIFIPETGSRRYRLPRPVPLKEGDKLPPMLFMSHLHLEHDPVIIPEVGISQGGQNFIGVDFAMLQMWIAVKRVAATFKKYFP